MYSVKNYAGAVVIPDLPDSTGIDNTSTSLTFFGRNVPDFAPQLNTNLLHLMEHFCSSNPPAKPVTGQLWYNSDKQAMMVCTSASAKTWQTLASVS
jgi:hypothetical protein